MARVRLVGAAEGARTFAVELSNTGGHPSGSVTVTGHARSEGARRLQADTCDEVADALALMVVLAIDPGALSAPEASPAAPAAIDAGAPALVDGAAPIEAASSLEAGVPLDGSAAPDAAAVASSPVPPPPAIPPAPADSARSRVRVARFTSSAAVISRSPPAYPLGALHRRALPGLAPTEGSLLGASVRVAFLRVGTGSVALVDGGADFTWTVGRVDGCALLWPSSLAPPRRRARAWRPASSRSSARASRRPERGTAPGSAAGPLARLEWSFFGPLVLDVGAGPSFHISAEQFYFRPVRQERKQRIHRPLRRLHRRNGRRHPFSLIDRRVAANYRETPADVHRRAHIARLRSPPRRNR